MKISSEISSLAFIRTSAASLERALPVSSADRLKNCGELIIDFARWLVPLRSGGDSNNKSRRGKSNFFFHTIKIASKLYCCAAAAPAEEKKITDWHHCTCNAGKFHKFPSKLEREREMSMSETPIRCSSCSSANTGAGENEANKTIASPFSLVRSFS